MKDQTLILKESADKVENEMKKKLDIITVKDSFRI